jgi:transposase-like protein
MANDHHSSDFKQYVYKQYRAGDRSAGPTALARDFDLSDPSLVKSWLKKWDGTPQSFENKHPPGRKRKLTEEESKQHVLDFVRKKNRIGDHVDYNDVQKEVKKRTGKDVGISTLKRYGHQHHGITNKQTTRKLITEGIIVPLLLLAHVA